MIDNIGIAFGTEIENVVLGTGNDQIRANEYVNVFTFKTGFGNDVIDGFSAGVDSLKFEDNGGAPIGQASIFANASGSDLVFSVAELPIRLQLLGLGTGTPVFADDDTVGVSIIA